MKIHHVYVPYHWNSYSVMRSMHEELQRRATLVDNHEDADVIWLSGINAKVPQGCKKKIVTVGFTDPPFFQQSRYNQSDIYITTSKVISDKYPEKVVYFPIYADKRYFKPVNTPVTHDCLFVGTGKHPRMPQRERYIKKLRAQGYKVLVAGKGWTNHPDTIGFVQGDELIKCYSSAKVILDFSNDTTSMTSRIFQGLMCGTPLLTYYREDVFDLIGDGAAYYTKYSEIEYAVRDVINIYDMRKKRSLEERDALANTHDVTARFDKAWPIIMSRLGVK